MIGPAILALIGLLLIFLEFYLPGMILGVLGSLFLLLSIVKASMQADSAIEVFVFFCAVVAALVGVIVLAIRRIRSNKGTLYLNSDQAGYVASEYDAATIGQHGVATTDLKPSGHAHIAGKDYQVVSQSGYVTEGTPIVVIAGQGAVLVVKPLKQETSV